MGEAGARKRMLAGFAAEHQDLLATVGKKWPAFIDRMRKEGMTVEYDPEEDILFLFPGSSPLPASTESLAENVYVRLDRDTRDLLGIEVLGFMGNLARMKLAQFAFGRLLPEIGKQQTLIQHPGSGFAPLDPGDLEKLFTSVA